jgi:hypothetical protein
MDSQSRSKHPRRAHEPAAATLCVLVFALCNFIGWVLSAVHALNKTGYALSILAAGAMTFWWMRASGISIRPPNTRKWRRRFRRPFAMGFLTLVALAAIGGAIYQPGNYDGLAYRTPRVLHWLAENQWHWIHTDFGRLNSRGAGFEWATAPLLLFAGTDHLVFLINLACFALMPGRCYAVFTRLGARRKTAYAWMWLFAAALGFVMQGGSSGSDLFGAFCAACAIEFALRARQSGRSEALWISGMAAGLATASKGFNLLLLLPWFVAAAPAFKLLLRKPIVSLVFVIVGLSASFLPTAILNAKHCGDWTGLAVEPVQFDVGSPVSKIIGNTIIAIEYNFVPPVFPFAKATEAAIRKVIPANFINHLEASFEYGWSMFWLPELQMEEWAGLGMGLSLLLLSVAVWRMKHRNGAGRRMTGHQRLVVASVFLALLVFMAKSGLYGFARYMMPFYLLIAAPLLASNAADMLARNRIWRRCAALSFVIAAFTLAATPMRPLWPALAVLRAAGADRSEKPALQRLWAVFHIYRLRADGFAPLREKLPANAEATTLGFVTGDDPEASLWRPFGARRVLHITAADSRESIRGRGIRYAAVNPNIVVDQFKMPVEEWLQRNRAEVVARIPLHLLIRKGPVDWLVVRFAD